MVNEKEGFTPGAEWLMKKISETPGVQRLELALRICVHLLMGSGLRTNHN